VNHLRRLGSQVWANLHVISVALYLAMSVIPATAGSNLDRYDFRWGWVAAGWIGVLLCVVAVVRPPRWRLIAGGWASSFIVLRAVYVEWRFGALVPWSSMALAFALAIGIAWSWGRPPTGGGKIHFELVDGPRSRGRRRTDR